VFVVVLVPALVHADDRSPASAINATSAITEFLLLTCKYDI
jgi:hypothetical protein